jgi:molecular chaperone DnaJ
MTKKDYYEVLGVSKTSDADEVKKAFRNRARHLHPDNKVSGDEAAFKELAEAYEVLSDNKKRPIYDRYGHEGVKGSTRNFDEVDFSSFAGFGMDDLIDAFFGGGMRSSTHRGGAEQGAHLKYELEIDFLEAVFGTEKKVSIKRLEDCTTCNGSGAATGSKISPCTTCGGMGQVQQVVNSWFGQSVRVIECPDCQGVGQRIEKPCRECRGEGLLKESREFDLKIPAGIDSGSRLRLSAGGNKGKRGGPFGDLFVVVHINEHERFVRDGVTIHLQQSIGFAISALGGEVLVPTVDGQKAIKVVAGTQSGTTIVLKDLGVPRLSNPLRRGDQVVHLVVETPTKLNSEEKKLLAKFAQLRGESLEIVNIENAADAELEAKLAIERPSKNGDKASSPEASEKEESSLIDKIVDAFRPKNGEQEEQ